MTRSQNWPSLLASFLRDRAGAPFVWGSNDCLLFCADLVQELTGEDLASEFRGHYNTAADANALIEPYGGVEGVLTAKLGEPKLIGFANRGDIAVFAHGGVACAGAVDESGARVVFFAEGRGMVRLPLRVCTRAWGY